MNNDVPSDSATDNRVKHPNAVAAKNEIKSLCNHLNNKMARDGFSAMPTDAEWKEIHRLVRQVIIELQPQSKVSDHVQWIHCKQVERRYPDVHLQKLMNQIITTLATRAAPVDRLRAKYWADIQKADHEQLADLNCDVGLIQWVLERGQWQPNDERQNLSVEQWKRLDEILRPFVPEAKNPVNKVIQSNASYKELSQARAEGGRCCLRRLSDSADHCRKHVGQEFSRQLLWLWSLDSDELQTKIRGIAHVSNGRARYTCPEKAGNFIEEARPPSRKDQKALKQRNQTHRRVKKYRERLKDSN